MRSIVRVVVVAGALASPPAANAEEPKQAWSLVGISVDQRALVVAPSEVHAPGGTVRVTRDTASEVSLEYTAAVAPPTNPDPDTVISGGVPSPLPHYVVKLKGKLGGRRVTGPEKVGRLFDALSWNAWRGASEHEAYAVPQRFKAPSTVGLHASDAKEILAGLGVAAKSIKVRGPRNGVVVKQQPSRTKMITPGSARIALVTRQR